MLHVIILEEQQEKEEEEQDKQEEQEYTWLVGWDDIFITINTWVKVESWAKRYVFSSSI